MITAVLVGDRDLIARLNAMQPALQANLGRAMTRLWLAMIRKVQAEKLSGQVLKVRTGSLRSSISGGQGVSRIEQSASSITAIVGTNIKYAGIHEFGGTQPARTIVPVKARALAFDWKGQQRFYRRVQRPAVKYPERSFLRSSLRDMEPQIRAELEAAVRSTVKT